MFASSTSVLASRLSFTTILISFYFRFLDCSRFFYDCRNWLCMVLNVHGIDFVLAIIFNLLGKSNNAVFQQMVHLSESHAPFVTANLIVTLLA